MKLLKKKITKKGSLSLPDSDKYYFDETAANEAVDFFCTYLTYQRGKKGFQPYQPMEWEKEKVIKPIFGWKRKKGRAAKV